MKKIFILMSITFLSFLKTVETTNSYFHDRTVQRASYETEIILDFYINPANDEEIGFRLIGTQELSDINYKISYKKENNETEAIIGDIINTNFDNEIIREWFYLGSCTSNGTCIDHLVMGQILLEVDLRDTNGDIVNLSRTLDIE